jgi:hypothetical protein
LLLLLLLLPLLLLLDEGKMMRGILGKAQTLFQRKQIAIAI